MLWFILIIFLMAYVIFSLSTIKYELKKISKHLNIKDGESEMVSEEEIEKELDNFYKS